MKRFLLMLRLQRTQLWNQWRSFGGRAGWSLLIQSALALMALLGIHLVISAFVDRLLDPWSAEPILGPLRYTRYEKLADSSARLMSFFLALTCLSGLCLPRAARDSAWDWFQEQPMPMLPLFIHRCLIESLLPTATALFIGPLGFALLTRLGMSWPWALGQTLGFIVLLQALIAAPRVLLDLTLRRRPLLRLLPGLLSPLFLLFAAQALSPEANAVVRVVQHAGTILDALPTAWLLAAALGQEGAWLKLALAIAVVHGSVYAIAAVVLRRPLAEFQAAAGRASKTSPAWRNRLLGQTLWDRLHPLTRRDLRLVLRDRQVIVNILGAPLLLLILPLKPQIWPANPLPMVFALAFLAGLLFLLGSVFYILPMEGRSLWMLYTWPQSVSRFLQRRLRGLLILATGYSAIVLFWGAHQQGIGWFDAGRLLYVLWGLWCFAQILMALAVFAWQPHEGYRWGPGRNLGLFVLGVLYAMFLFPADAAACVSMMLLLGAVTALLVWHLNAFLPTLLDARPPPARWVTGLLASLLIGTSLLWLGFHA